ncbi:MAG TPA: TPM domain-containing protein [Longimicrobium sp.]|nr:TPM domain-containing protein [Longimicrobium sp.]
MRKNFVLTLAVLLMAAPLGGQTLPEEPGDGIADLAGVLSPAQEGSIRALMDSLRAAPGVEMRLLTVPSVAAHGGSPDAREAFATQVYNAWKLGYGQRQDGVLVLLSVQDRWARIELGDGVPPEQDARMQQVMEGVMVPRFRAGDYSGGLVDGVMAIARAFRGPAAPAPASAAVSSSAAAVEPAPAADREEYYIPPPRTRAPDVYREPLIPRDSLLIVGVVALGIAALGVYLYLRHRPRRCEHCLNRMERLSETADDVHLDSGRKLEEVMGSVDYDVWSCTTCRKTVVKRYPSLLRRREACGSCGYRTVVRHDQTISPATYSSSGLERVTRDCRHCGWHDEDTIVLPRLQRSESSGSSLSGSSSSSGWSGGGGSSGGGYSGGSSSGRGSSGSW